MYKFGLAIVSFVAIILNAPVVSNDSVSYNAESMTQERLDYLLSLVGAPEEQEVSMLSMDDLCPHDPGHHPNYDEWVNGTTLPACNGTYNALCLSLALTNYSEWIEAYDELYRWEVCGCWATYPNNVVPREACIEAARRKYEALQDEREAIRNAHISDCCIVNP